MTPLGRRFPRSSPASKSGTASLLALLLVPALAAAGERAVPSLPPALVPAGPSIGAVIDAGVARGALSPELGRDLRLGAYQDPLTGLPNKTFVQDGLGTLLADRKSLITYKLDWLKEVNDSRGHDDGNRLLAAVSGVARSVLGPGDELVRRSPTGFAVFTYASGAEAKLLAQSLRAALELRLGDPGVLFDGAAPHGGTINLGVASFGPEASGPARYRKTLLDAETARLAAKGAGGNLVGVASRAGPRVLPPRSLAELSSGAEPGLAARLQRAAGEALSALLPAPGPSAPMSELLARVSEPALRQALHGAVYRDPLSGLRNRKWLFDHLHRVVGPRGYAHMLALDIDRYGRINELVGEDKADLVIRELGILLAEETRRRGALVVHLSGEEFLVLLHRGRGDPRPFAEALRKRVEAELGRRVLARHGVADPATQGALPVTVSIGAAPIVVDPSRPVPVFTLSAAMAEAMLQRAKENGRNRVDFSDDPEVLAAHLARFVRVDDDVRALLRRLSRRRR